MHQVSYLVLALHLNIQIYPNTVAYPLLLLKHEGNDSGGEWGSGRRARVALRALVVRVSRRLQVQDQQDSANLVFE